jgi:3-isopropylmalate/(R)-2-methylmalate dehydratase small subunit
MTLKGRVHKYGADVNTDVIIPARYLRTEDSASLMLHCMEDIDTAFVKRVKPGDFIVAGENFGCGSSREQAATVIKESGISCVIASSFGRIFFRNAINIGLPILESPEASRVTEMGDELEVDFAAGKIHNLTREKIFQAKPFPDFMRGIINRGGLIAYTRDRLKKKIKKSPIE